MAHDREDGRGRGKKDKDKKSEREAVADANYVERRTSDMSKRDTPKMGPAAEMARSLARQTGMRPLVDIAADGKEVINWDHVTATADLRATAENAQAVTMARMLAHARLMGPPRKG